MIETRPRLLVGLALAALALCSAASGAGAASLIGSKNIADDSIRSIDIKDGAIAGRDVKDGSLQIADFGDDAPSGAPGPVGPTGSVGPSGPDGPTGPNGPGAVGPDQVVTWTGHYDPTGTADWTAALVTSSDTLPPNSLVRGVALTVSGDFSTCSGFAEVTFRPTGTATGDGDLGLVQIPPGSPADIRSFNHEMVNSLTGATPLSVFARCQGSAFDDIAIPSFDFTATVAVTQLDAPTPTTFN